jgi:hypothetical protein
MGASTSWNPQGLSRPVMGFVYTTVEFQHPVAAVLTPSQTKQIRINIQNKTKTKTQHKQYKNNKYKYTVLHEKLISLCIYSRNFPHFYETRRFFTEPTSARHLSLF